MLVRTSGVGSGLRQWRAQMGSAIVTQAPLRTLAQLHLLRTRAAMCSSHLQRETGWSRSRCQQAAAIYAKFECKRSEQLAGIHTIPLIPYVSPYDFLRVCALKGLACRARVTLAARMLGQAARTARARLYQSFLSTLWSTPYEENIW
jgi:hypothetical protein